MVPHLMEKVHKTPTAKANITTVEADSRGGIDDERASSDMSSLRIAVQAVRDAPRTSSASAASSLHSTLGSPPTAANEQAMLNYFCGGDLDELLLALEPDEETMEEGVKRGRTF